MTVVLLCQVPRFPFGRLSVMISNVKILRKIEVDNLGLGNRLQSYTRVPCVWRRDEIVPSVL